LKEIDGKYDVVRQLGEGGMGCVYEARHRVTSRAVAVKVILEEVRIEPAAVARFQREARAVGSIDSEHITQVLDGGVDAATSAPYIVMELLAGEDVDALVKRLGPLRPELALRIVAQMLAGLARAHDAGVIHRDIKPANVFLAKKGSGEIVVKLCDFGIAKVKQDPFASGSESHALTQSSTLIGSPSYMSPEQAKGAKDLDARADVWSAGVVLYQLLSGTTPHGTADTLGLLLLAICSEKAPPVRTHAPWVKEEVAAIVARALDLDIDARFPSAAAMRDAIVAQLPDGTRIDESTLTALTDEERAFVPEPLSAPVDMAHSQTVEASLPDAPAVSSPARAPPPRRWPLAVIGLAAVAVIGIGAAKLANGSGTPTNAVGLSANAVASSAAPSASASAIETAAVSASAIETASAIASSAITLRPTPAARGSARIGGLASVKPRESSAPPSTPPVASSSGIYREFK
jgi:serine/threonine-protein kinase